MFYDVDGAMSQVNIVPCVTNFCPFEVDFHVKVCATCHARWLVHVEINAYIAGTRWPRIPCGKQHQILVVKFFLEVKVEIIREAICTIDR
jgi:hypothetical protein